MAAPSALIASCSSLEPKNIVQRILGTDDELPPGQKVLEDVEAYPWHIDTKYYTTDIHLCTTGTRTIGDKKFADSVGAFIVHFDPSQISSFDKVKMWLPFLKEIDPAVQLLVCNRCEQNNAVTRIAALNWCLDNSFELVELNPAEDSDSESEDDFKETTGIPRIIQALHAHTWPNLVMKEHPAFRSQYMNNIMAEEARNKQDELLVEIESNNIKTLEAEKSTSKIESENITDSVGSNEPSDCKIVLVDGAQSLSNPDSNKSSGESKKEKNSTNSEEKHGTELLDSLIKDDMSLFAALGNEDPGDESFEQLFERMKIMKETAASLPPDQRKMYAEQVAISFWRAMGGAEEEIEGLSDSD